MLTVPSSAVDAILKILMRIGVIDGMSTEEHENFNVSDTIGMFEKAGFRLKRWTRFQPRIEKPFCFPKN